MARATSLILSTSMRISFNLFNQLSCIIQVACNFLYTCMQYLASLKMCLKTKICITATRKKIYIKILSMRCINLAKNTPEAEISAF
jgi:hypothetical protein